jgi:hypothetical protein
VVLQVVLWRVLAPTKLTVFWSRSAGIANGQSGQRFYGPSAGELEEKIMTKIVHGTVHGKTIELDQELGLADGQQVEVAIQIPGAVAGAEPWGEGLRRCAGALADIPGLDEDMEQILAQRKTARFREVPE